MNFFSHLLFAVVEVGCDGLLNERKGLYLSIIVTHHPLPHQSNPPHAQRLAPSHKSLKKHKIPLPKKLKKQTVSSCIFDRKFIIL